MKHNIHNKFSNFYFGEFLKIAINRQNRPKLYPRQNNRLYGNLCQNDTQERNPIADLHPARAKSSSGNVLGLLQQKRKLT
jgi:hypothetical protein